MPDASVLKEISSRLSESPFSITVSAVSLDEHSWPELVSIMKQVIVQVSPSSKDKTNDDAAFIAHLIDLVHILNFEASKDGALTIAISQKNKETLYAILHWILMNFEATKLRAYLAQFLLPVDVPGEFMDDENISTLRRTHAELQQEFQRLHSDLSELQKTAPPVDAVKDEIAVLDREKQQLTEKIAALKSRTAGDQGFAALLAVTSSLRIQQEEEANLADKLVDQRRQLIAAEDALQTAGHRYETKRKQLEKFQSKEFLAHFKSEVELMESEQNQALVETDELTRRLEQLQKSLGDAVPIGALQDLESTVQRLDSEVAKLKQLIASASNQETESDSKLSMFKQQATLAARKREGFERELKMEAELLANVEAELRTREEKFKAIKGVKFVAKADFKQYAQSLREKTAVFKKKQPELRYLSAEASILSRTEQILRESLREKGLNPEDFSQAAPVLTGFESSSETLALELNELNAKLRNKKLELTPMLKALKQTRQESDAFKAEYTKRKTAFDEKVRPTVTRLKQVRTETESVDEAILESTIKVKECGVTEGILKREAEANAETLATLANIQTDGEVEMARLKNEISNRKDRQQQAALHRDGFAKLKKILCVKLAFSGVKEEFMRGSQGKDILQM